MIGATPQPNDESVWHQLPWRSMAVLTAALALTWAIASAVAHHRYGATGVLAASIAAGVCWTSAGGALCITAFSRGQGAVNAVLLSVLLRTGLPLAAGMVISVSHDPLAEAGVFGLILIHYLVALAVETPLAVRLVRQRTAAADRSP